MHRHGVPLATSMNRVYPDRAVNDSDTDLHRAILGYLADNPDAMDTLEGIAGWWVARQRVAVSVRSCERVLRDLIGQGLIEEVGPGEPKRYRLRSAGSEAQRKF
jgi:hypothetical protein